MPYTDSLGAITYQKKKKKKKKKARISYVFRRVAGALGHDGYESRSLKI